MEPPGMVPDSEKMLKQFFIKSECCPGLSFQWRKQRLPHWLSGKETACNAGATGDSGSVPG